MKIIIAILLICITSNTFALMPFEQAYKNAKTSTQKIRVLLAELKTKDAEITKLKEQIAQRTTIREQELLDKILILNASNEEKDREIQRLGQVVVPESTRCTKDYWTIDKKGNKVGFSASMILSYNAEQRNECLAGKR